MSKRKIITIASSVIVIVVAIIIIKYILSFKGYDDDACGNTALNLYNGGFFCEADGIIYFSNPNDNGYLYSMNHNLSDIKLIQKSSASYINANAPYVFYTVINVPSSAYNFLTSSTNGIYRTDLDNGKTKILSKSPTKIMNLHGNNLFYQSYDKSYGLRLYKVDINGNSKEELDESYYECAQFDDGKIICSSIDNDHYISAYNLDNKSLQTVSTAARTTMVSVVDNYFYFLDIDKDYRLCRLRKGSQEVEVLSTYRCCTYNVSIGGKYAYMQVDDTEHNGLYKINLKSKEETLICEGDYNSINTTTDYVFFREVGKKDFKYVSYSDNKVKDFNPQ